MRNNIVKDTTGDFPIEDKADKPAKKPARRAKASKPADKEGKKKATTAKKDK